MGMIILMDQMDWEVIDVLFKEENITKAAEKMFISQPALTYRIKSIEKKLNIQMIYRTKKGIKFTREGLFVAKQSEMMVSQFQKLVDTLQNLNDNDEGFIRIGVSTNFARYMLPELLNTFLNHYPKTQFNVTTSWSKSILRLIEKENINIAIIRGDCIWEHEKVLLRKEPIYVVSNEPINLEELPNKPRIIFNTDPSLQQTINQWWKQNFNKPPKVMMEIDNVETCTKLIEKGLGYAILPSISVSNKKHLYKLVLKDKYNNTILRDTWLLYHLLDMEYPIIKSFINFLINTFKKY